MAGQGTLAGAGGGPDAQVQLVGSLAPDRLPAMPGVTGGRPSLGLAVAS